MSGINMAQIYANADTFDTEQLHHYILNKVNSGEYDTCLEALSNYIETNDIDVVSIKSIISPALRYIIYKEAREKNLLSYHNVTEIPESLFV